MYDWKTPLFDYNDVEITRQETLYKDFFRVDKVSFKHRLFDGGWTGEVSREVFRRGAAAGVLLYDPERDSVGLVEQYRAGALNEPESPWCLEVVAGMIDEGESPQDVVLRESVEEAGVTPYRLEYIARYLPSPGGCDEVKHIFCGLTDLGKAGGVHGLQEENEDIRVHVLPADEVFDNLYGGRFNSASVLLCLQWLQLNRDRLRAVQTC